MQKGNNSRGKEKIILLTREAFFLFLSNYTVPKNPQPLTRNTLLTLLLAQHALLPCPDIQSTSRPPNPLVTGKHDVSTPATSATHLGGERPEITYLPIAKQQTRSFPVVGSICTPFCFPQCQFPHC